MSFTRARMLVRRGRLRLALLAVMVFLAGTVIMAHSSLGEHHMGGDAAMCLAVLTAGAAAAVGLVRSGGETLGTPCAIVPLVAAVVFVPVTHLVPRRSRAGPAVLQVFLR